MIANYTGTGSRGSFTFKRNVLLPEERLSLRSQTIASLIMSETTEKPAISTSLNKALALKIVQGNSNLLTQSRSVEAGIGNPIGPGYYNCNESTLSGPSFKFSTISRFQKDYLTPIAPTKKFNTCKNKDLELYTPVNKKKKNQLKAIDQNNKIEKALQKKKSLVKEKKEKFLSEIECKKQRFEWKQQKFQIKVIAQSWLSLVFAVGPAQLFRAKLDSQKQLHKRAMKYLKIWQLLSQVIGKFRSKLWKNRKSKAVMTLCRMVGVTKAWIATRRLKYKATLTNILEANVTKNILMRLMYQYKRKIIFIQRTVKRLLVENRLTWPYRLLLWNRLESKINLRKKEKAITRPKIQIASKKERRSVRERGFSRIIAPQENWFKEKIKEHMKSLENYRTNVKNMIGDYKKLLYRKLFSSVHQNITVEELVLPAKPEMRYDLSEGEMRKLIVSAYEQLDKWESIIFDSNTKRKYFMGQVSRFHNRKSIIKQQYNLE